MFGDLRKEVGEAISKVCKLEGVRSSLLSCSLGHKTNAEIAEIMGISVSSVHNAKGSYRA